MQVLIPALKWTGERCCATCYEAPCYGLKKDLQACVLMFFVCTSKDDPPGYHSLPFIRHLHSCLGAASTSASYVNRETSATDAIPLRGQMERTFFQFLLVAVAVLLAQASEKVS